MLNISLQTYQSSPDLSVKERKLPRGVSTRVNKANQGYGSTPNRTNCYLLCQWSALEQPLSTDLFKECFQLGCLDKGSKPVSTPIFQCANQPPEVGEVIPTPPITHAQRAADGCPKEPEAPNSSKQAHSISGHKQKQRCWKARWESGQRTGQFGVFFAVKNSDRR